MILWGRLGTHEPARARASAWLVGEAVHAPAMTREAAEVSAHDTSIRGWPWVEGTHSWVEPTAMAVLALAGSADPKARARVADGLRLLADRAVASGGWNYGSNAVFGCDLRGQPGPTGLALLALAAAGGGPSPTVDRAIAYLRATLPTVRAAASLGWGVMGLRAWGAAPDVAGTWLAESAAEVLPRDDDAPRLALLLLAHAPRSLEVLGLPSPTPAATPARTEVAA